MPQASAEEVSFPEKLSLQVALAYSLTPDAPQWYPLAPAARKHRRWPTLARIATHAKECHPFLGLCLVNRLGTLSRPPRALSLQGC